jgi:hypothetical protein
MSFELSNYDLGGGGGPEIPLDQRELAEDIAVNAVKELYENLGDRAGLNEGEPGEPQVVLLSFDPSRDHDPTDRVAKERFEISVATFYQQLGLASARYVIGQPKTTEGDFREPATAAFTQRSRVRIPGAPIDGLGFAIQERRSKAQGQAYPTVKVWGMRIRRP